MEKLPTTGEKMAWSGSMDKVRPVPRSWMDKDFSTWGVKTYGIPWLSAGSSGF